MLTNFLSEWDPPGNGEIEPNLVELDVNFPNIRPRRVLFIIGRDLEDLPLCVVLSDLREREALVKDRVKRG